MRTPEIKCHRLLVPQRLTRRLYENDAKGIYAEWDRNIDTGLGRKGKPRTENPPDGQ